MTRFLILTATLFFPHLVFSQPQKKVQRSPAAVILTKPPFNLKDDPLPYKYLAFKNDTPVYIPKGFYIQEIIDNTGFADSCGFVLQPKSGKSQKVVFKNGTLNAYKDYTDFKIKKDSSLYPLTLIIKQVEVSEEKNKDYRNGSFKYHYSVEFMTKEKPLQISGNQGRFTYTVHVSQPRPSFDSLLGRSIMDMMDNIDENIQEAASQHPAFCKGVNVNISYRTSSAENADTLFYNGNGYLSWDDYQAPPVAGDNYFLQHMGLFFKPVIDYSGSRYHVTIQTGAYFVRSMSWAGRKVRTTAMENHLQYKFYLVWLEAVRLKKRIESAAFTCENFENEVRVLADKSISQLQYAMDEYTKQTMVGANSKEQHRWQEFIDKQLAEYEKPF